MERVSAPNAKLDEELRGTDWFDAANYPTIRFVSTTVTHTGKGTARIVGTLTLHGVSKPFNPRRELCRCGHEPAVEGLNRRLQGDRPAKARRLRCLDRDMRVTAFNKAHADSFFRVFGHRAAVGEVLPDLFPSDQAQILTELMKRALAGEVFTVVEPFGDPHRAQCFEVNYAPPRDETGQVIGAFHYAQAAPGHCVRRSVSGLGEDAPAAQEKAKAGAIRCKAGGLQAR